MFTSPSVPYPASPRPPCRRGMPFRGLPRVSRARSSEALFCGCLACDRGGLLALGPFLWRWLVLRQPSAGSRASWGSITRRRFGKESYRPVCPRAGMQNPQQNTGTLTLITCKETYRTERHLRQVLPGPAHSGAGRQELG